MILSPSPRCCYSWISIILLLRDIRRWRWRWRLMRCLFYDAPFVRLRSFTFYGSLSCSRFICAGYPRPHCCCWWYIGVQHSGDKFIFSVVRRTSVMPLTLIAERPFLCLTFDVWWQLLYCLLHLCCWCTVDVSYLDADICPDYVRFVVCSIHYVAAYICWRLDI